LIKEERNLDFMVGDINVSPQHNMLTKGELTSNLQPKAMALLYYLAKNRDRVINNDELLEQVWQGRVVTNSSIQKCVNALRAAFAELDSSSEYVKYFSKRGYQLVTPKIHNSHLTITSRLKLQPSLIIIAVVIAAYFFYLYYPTKVTNTYEPNTVDVIQFSQVKPFASNTGREAQIEPHNGSERVALIRNENSTLDEVVESQLFIHGMNSNEWQVAAARGNFTRLSWSLSGRNLVAIDSHSDPQGTQHYSTLHIYTLDFKGEKVIEKNILSHWLGDISSVSWWDEGTLEFTATQGNEYLRERYRYSIADQNLSKLQSPVQSGKLINSYTFNQFTVIHSLSNSAEQIYFLDEQQKTIKKQTIPFKVKSISWLSDGKGIILLSADNQLSILYTDGRLLPLEYSPKINGDIHHVKSINKGKNLVLTIQPLTLAEISISEPITNKIAEIDDTTLVSQRFMENGGGFIYSSTDDD
jgi:DNA-binding winged helix-turn-helix (wHTH) protein